MVCSSLKHRPPAISKSNSSTSLSEEPGPWGHPSGCQAKEDVLVYLASPRVRSLDDMQASHIYLSDLPMWDVSREFVLLAEQRHAEVRERAWCCERLRGGL